MEKKILFKTFAFKDLQEKDLNGLKCLDNLVKKYKILEKNPYKKGTERYNNKCLKLNKLQKVFEYNFEHWNTLSYLGNINFKDIFSHVIYKVNENENPKQMIKMRANAYIQALNQELKIRTENQNKYKGLTCKNFEQFGIDGTFLKIENFQLSYLVEIINKCNNLLGKVIKE